jgi:hypothetical protein
VNARAIIPGIIARAARAGIQMPKPDAEILAIEMLEFRSLDQRMKFLDERLSELYDEYGLHLFLTKRADYRVTINAKA